MSGKTKKELIIETLDKVERAALPLFIQHLKLNTFMRLALGEISEDTSSVILETCEEYLAAQSEEGKK